MLKRLVRIGKAFPNRLFVGISLLLWLLANGAPATQKCDCPCAKDQKQPSAAESLAGQVTIFWPRPDNFLTRALHSKADVQIDAAVVGTVDFDAPLTISVPNGPHKLVVKGKARYLENISKRSETQITVSAQNPLYFQIIDNTVGLTASEVDAATAQVLLSGAMKNSWQAVPSGTGTIYFYWPRNGLNLGFLDKLNTDSRVFLDGKRIGAFTNGDYLVVKAPSGEHVLSVDMSQSSGPLLEQNVILGAGSTRYFRVEKRFDFRIIEDSPEEAAEFPKKELRQREVSLQ
ncbi:MAG: DUF2846 domain-containing protein [Rhodomicrobium sp.]